MPRSFLIKKHHHLGCGLSTAELLQAAAMAEKAKNDSQLADKEDIVLSEDEAEEKGPYDLSTKSPQRIEPPAPSTGVAPIAKPLPLTPLNLNTHYGSAPYNVWVPKAMVPPHHPSYLPFTLHQMYSYNQQISQAQTKVIRRPDLPVSENFHAVYAPTIDTETNSSPAPTPSPSSSAESDTSTSVGPILQKCRKSNSNMRLQCDDCGKSYSTFSGLTKHKHLHCASHNKKSFSCKFCEKVYVSLGALKMHIRTHTLPCKCHLCGKAFSRPWLLQGHIRTHTGEKPFACSHCNRAFADRSNLRAHLQTHSDVKKYCCQSCSKTFSRMSLLLKHEVNGCPATTVRDH